MPVKDLLEKALIDAVRDSFKTMLAVDLEDAVVPSGDASAELICTIGAAGKLEGSISVSLSDASACAIVSRMLQDQIAEVSAEVCDGMCEVVNLIAGGVKIRTAGQDCAFEISIPTVVQGKLLRISVTDEVERVSRRFKASNFCFDVEFIFKINRGQKAGQKSKEGHSSKMSAFEKLKALTGKTKDA